MIVPYDHESGHAFNGTPGSLFAFGKPQAWFSLRCDNACNSPLVPLLRCTANGSPAWLSRLRRCRQTGLAWPAQPSRRSRPASAGLPWPIILLLLCALPAPAWPARIAVVMDDMGNQWAMSKRIVDLPGPVAVAILPGTPFARRLGRLAHARGKEILAHLPMESADDQPLGPYALRLEMTHAAFASQLHSALETIPFVSGVNNHMGSMLTRHPGHMAWLMETLQPHTNWYFLDSRTTAKTVAQEVAREYAIPALRRDVFLDDVRSLAAVTAQFRRLLALARRHGSALAIGHPHAVTIRALEALLPTLTGSDVELVAPHELLSIGEQSALSRNHRLVTGRRRSVDQAGIALGR